MSIALWSNILIDKEVVSDESDKYALHKHSKKLDKLTTKLNVCSFLSTHDFTDMQFNLSDDELQEGMDSTDQLMAVKGVWIDGSTAVEMLESLISHIVENNVKFGILGNDAEEVITELKESLELANKANEAKGKFNFSVVM